MGDASNTRAASMPKPHYMMNPKDVRIAELETKLTTLGAMGDEKQ
jgi:hypothetical protein